VIAGADGRINLINGRTESLFRWKRDQLIGQTVTSCPQCAAGCSKPTVMNSVGARRRQLMPMDITAAAAPLRKDVTAGHSIDRASTGTEIRCAVDQVDPPIRAGDHLGVRRRFKQGPEFLLRLLQDVGLAFQQFRVS